MSNLDPDIRRRVAALATDFQDGRLTYAEFVSALPEIRRDVDDPVTELLDLFEHQPAPGGWFGVSPAEHAAYVADLRRRVGELAR